MEISYLFSFLNISLCPGMLRAFRVQFMGTEVGEIKFTQMLARLNLLSGTRNFKDSKGQL